MDLTQSFRIDRRGILESPKNIHLCAEKMRTLETQEQLLFTLSEIPSILIINEVCANALCAAGLQGFKTIPLATWREGLCYEDPYLAPHHHPDIPDPLYT